MRTAIDVALWVIVLTGAGLYAVAAQPKTSTLVFATGVIFFLGGVLVGGYWGAG
jgi:hypothetical protein